MRSLSTVVLRKYLPCVFFLFCVGLLPASEARALSLTPDILELHVQPDETKTFVVHVQNDENERVRIIPSIQKFLPMGSEGRQLFLPPSDIRGLPSWTFIDGTDLPFEPHERRAITISLRVPKESDEYTAYQVIFFSSSPIERASTAPVSIQSRLGVLLLVTIGTPANPELSLAKIAASPVGWTSSLQKNLQIDLHNVGRSHTTPQGTVLVQNTFKHVTHRLALNPSQARILPQSTRIFSVQIGDEIPRPGKKSFFSEIISEITHFGLGRYTVTIENVEGLTPTQLQNTFWVFPWRLLLSALILVGVILCLLRLYRNRIYRSLNHSS